MEPERGLARLETEAYDRFGPLPMPKGNGSPPGPLRPPCSHVSHFWVS